MDFRVLKVGETDPRFFRVYFDVKLAADNTPALNEVGGQPELSLNGSSWNPVGIGTLVPFSYGNYYAELQANLLNNVISPGDIIKTRYKGILTLETPGDSFQVIGNDVIVPIPTTPAVAQLSYVTVAEANQYFDSRVNSSLWTATDNAEKLRSLKDATRRIDRLNFAGEKTDPSQLLQFPRKSLPIVVRQGFGFVFGLRDEDEDENFDVTEETDEQEQSLQIDTNIPADIQIACCEIAIALLDGRDPDLDVEQLVVDSQSYSGVRTSYNRKWTLEHVRAGIPSALAWSYLRPYLRDYRNLTITRSS